MKIQKQLIYDDNCPICKWYSHQFVVYGLLDKSERLSFESAQEQGIMEHIDYNKAKNEIPLRIPGANMILYGTDSIVYLLNLKFPGIKKIYNFWPVNWISKRLYKFVSYNRRIMVSDVCPGNSCYSAPTFNLKYRLLFLLFAILVSSAITIQYGEALVKNDLLDNPYKSLILCGAGWILTGVLAFFQLSKQVLWDFLGNLATTMIIGVFLLIPALVINLLVADIYSIIICTLFSFTVMFANVRRRTSNLDLGFRWTLIWAFLMCTSFVISILIL